MTSTPDPKTVTLRQRASLNPRPKDVASPLFKGSTFFDPRDLVQVKYEMVRSVRVDGEAVSHAANAFGFSRPSYYQAQSLLEQGGLAALVPHKPGPRRSHKLGAEVMLFVDEQLLADPSLTATQLVDHIMKRFACKVHPRSIERALERRKKKRP